MIKPGTSELNYDKIIACIEFLGFNIVAETKMNMSNLDIETFSQIWSGI